MGRARLAGGTRRRYWSPIRRVVEADVGRTALLEEAAAADGRAAWLDGFLARGDGLDSALSAPVVVELEPLPESGSPGRSGGVSYGSHVRRRRRPPLQRSLIQGRIWRTRISGLDRRSMRSGHRFTVGESFRSRLWSGANGALPHALEHRRRWGLLALGDLPKREHPL
jgi:hypothetical protein